jgi:hypothetical protein
MSITTKSSEVTEEWLKSELLANISGAQEVHVKKLERDKEQSGMLSCAIRAVVQIKGKEKTEDMKLFIKIMPEDDDHVGFISTNFMDVTEVESYKMLFKDLSEFEASSSRGVLSSISKLFPTMYAGRYVKDVGKRAYYLALEDVSPEYNMMDYNTGLTPKQLAKSLEKLAKFHALCFSMKKVKKVDFQAKYNFLSPFFSNMTSDDGLMKLMDNMFDWFIRELEPCAKHRILIKSIEHCKTDIGKRFKEAVCNESSEDFLIHGDLWANNLLFDKSSDCKMVDWQFTSTGSVFLDFGTMAYYSMAPKETEANMDSLINTYYSSFLDTTKEMGVPEVPWTREEFKIQARDVGHYTAFLWASTSYELVGKWPNIRERFHWNLEQAVERTPLLFQ